MRVTLYSRPGCHLCDDLKAALAALDGDIAFTLVERNIEDDLEDMQRYRYLIPVLDIENGPLLYPPHEWTTLVEALQSASSHAAGAKIQS
jgi:glutaredoxin